MTLFLKRFMVGHVRLQLVELIIFFKVTSFCYRWFRLQSMAIRRPSSPSWPFRVPSHRAPLLPPTVFSPPSHKCPTHDTKGTDRRLADALCSSFASKITCRQDRRLVDPRSYLPSITAHLSVPCGRKRLQI